MLARTTVRLDENLLEDAKHSAASQKRSLTSLIEEGLRRVLYPPASVSQPPRRKVDLPICRQGGGTLPGVDISNSADLLDILDGYIDPS